MATSPISSGARDVSWPNGTRVSIVRPLGVEPRSLGLKDRYSAFELETLGTSAGNQTLISWIKTMRANRCTTEACELSSQTRPRTWITPLTAERSTTLSYLGLERLAGFEPATFRVETDCSIQLSYRRIGSACKVCTRCNARN